MSENCLTTAKCIQNYFVIFYFLGIHIKLAIGELKRGHKRHLIIIPRAIHLILVIVTNYFNLKDTIGKPEPLIIRFPLILASIPNLIFIFNIDSCLTKVKAILSTLFETEHYMNKFIDVSVRPQALRREILMIFSTCVIIPSAIISCKIFLTSPTFSIVGDIIRTVLITYKYLCIFLVLILIGYKDLLLSSLNQKLKKTALFSLDSNVWGLFHLFGHIQIVYSRLHHITSLINLHFGWFLLTVVLDHFSNITSAILYIFINIIDPSYNFRTTRN